MNLHAIVKIDQVVQSDEDPNRFIVDASDLQLPPGRVPTQIATTLGNGQDFKLTNIRRDEEGDLMWLDYHQVDSLLSLRVFND